jgi:uncharacterized repeat protein (TIGR04138 family)
MEKPTFDEFVERIVAQDPRFGSGAYLFLREALEFTQERLAGEKEEGERHVTGQQLLDGIREYGLRELGPMACTVFAEWGVTRCEDFGEIVFNLIEHQVLRKTDTDSREDFRRGYDFAEAFGDPFLPPSRQRARNLTPTSPGETET